ncbi:FKBP-type peptidyl prolyl cis-trans isomerase /Apo-metallochaperone SlyD [Persephonella hydrogeniphila]|uniref:Peptidyl-prolyl cis-trans isomerase n=1 Tax=Persephonella hydrogeniphila TaxID=198703 RepID=A0A285NNQ0_9AQUI|nr:peptidylprolyl isomerase [Persephonella hydrogeniphila]SNZ10563.1 FKBP-type peptidyl prolyl cis-trans isomerase /Apo-metallochaperone SlyD [Persephonella hydrogeniphila]
MKATSNKVVTFHYTLKDKETGQVLDSSQEYGQPLTVLFGAENIIPGLESRMEGMETGEKRTIEVPAEEAYGTKNPELVQQVPKEYFQGIELEKGMPLQAQTPDGQIINMIVVDFDDNTVTVDMNHPLAGKDLVFEVEVVNVRDASLEEIQHGHPHGEGGVHH